MRDPRNVARSILDVVPNDESLFREKLNSNLTRMSHWAPELVNTKETWLEYAFILHQFGPKETDHWYNDVYDIWRNIGSSE